MQYKCDFCQDTGSMTTDYDSYNCVDCNVVEHRLALDTWLEDQYKNGLMRRIHGLDAWNIYRAALAMAPKQAAAVPTNSRSEQEVDNLIELAGALEVESVRQTILEMRLLRFREGPFQAGYETALDEIETRLGFELTEQAPLISDLGASNEPKVGNTDNSCDMPPWPIAAPAAANGALTDGQIFAIYESINNAESQILSFARAILAAAGPDAALVKALESALAIINNEADPDEYAAPLKLIRAALSGAKGN